MDLQKTIPTRRENDGVHLRRGRIRTADKHQLADSATVLGEAVMREASEAPPLRGAA
jgi:hypothetical protein